MISSPKQSQGEGNCKEAIPKMSDIKLRKIIVWEKILSCESELRKKYHLPFSWNQIIRNGAKWEIGIIFSLQFGQFGISPSRKS